MYLGDVSSFTDVSFADRAFKYSSFNVVLIRISYHVTLGLFALLVLFALSIFVFSLSNARIYLSHFKCKNFWRKYFQATYNLLYNVLQSYSFFRFIYVSIHDSEILKVMNFLSPNLDSFKSHFVIL